MVVFNWTENYKYIRELSSLTDILRLFPHVMPKKTFQLLRSARDGENIFEDNIISPDNVNELFPELSSRYYASTTIKATPEGAKTLEAMYMAGRLPLTKGKKPEEASIESYLEKCELIQQNFECHEFFVRNIDLVECDTFSIEFLTDAFFVHKHGLLDTSLKIGNIVVRKYSSSYKSNSGKNCSWCHEYSWNDTSQNHHRLESGEGCQRRNNRRNDESRNYGLPE
ncbi:MAG: hypothetical protein AB9900_02655 [Humidesulfovibrio sp.]